MTLLQTIFFATAPLLAMTNPIAEVPLFLSLVEGRTKAESHRAAVSVSIGVFIILSISAVGGLQILQFLGIQLAAFRGAGGSLSGGIGRSDPERMLAIGAGHRVPDQRPPI